MTVTEQQLPPQLELPPHMRLLRRWRQETRGKQDTLQAGRVLDIVRYVQAYCPCGWEGDKHVDVIGPKQVDPHVDFLGHMDDVNSDHHTGAGA